MDVGWRAVYCEWVKTAVRKANPHAGEELVADEVDKMWKRESVPESFSYWYACVEQSASEWIDWMTIGLL